MKSEILPGAGAEALWFHRGVSTRCYEYFGVHRIGGAEDNIYSFRVYAKGAQGVSLCGDFNGSAPVLMTEIGDSGIFELRYKSDIPLGGMRYLYRIERESGVTVSPDPFARGYEPGASGASIIAEPSDFEWGDSEWMKNRAKKGVSGILKGPVCAYCVHLGSWKRSTQGGDGFLNYREIGERLRDYVSDMGYTHVQLMPICEYPRDSSFGYSATGYFAPTSRYGSGDDLKYFVDTLHRAGIGVILEWNPLSFARSSCGSGGIECAFAPDRSKERAGVSRFDTKCSEVRSFLVSSAMFWIREFHVDGLAVRTGGTELPGSVRQASAGFFDALNTAVHSEGNGVFTVLCEPYQRSLPTLHKKEGGFDLFLNRPLVAGLFAYAGAGSRSDRKKYADLFLSAAYAIGCDVLPIGGREGIPPRVFFGCDSKFDTMRAVLGYTVLSVGKKMSLMGSEFGQLRGWDHENQLDWFLEDLPAHKCLRAFFRALNKYYRMRSELWGEGVSPVSCDPQTEGLVAFKRFSDNGGGLVCVVNLSSAEHPSCRINVGSRREFFRESFNSDREEFGGKGRENRGLLAAEDSFVTLRVPPMSVLVLEPLSTENFGEVTVENN